MSRYDDDDQMSGLASVLRHAPVIKKKKSPEELREEALAKALENTTPDTPGTPWKETEKFEGTEEEAINAFLDKMLGNE